MIGRATRQARGSVLGRSLAAALACALSTMAGCAAPTGGETDVAEAQAIAEAARQGRQVPPWRWQAAPASCHEGVLARPLGPEAGYELRSPLGAPELVAVVDAAGLVVCVDTAESLADARFGPVALGEGEFGLATTDWEALAAGLGPEPELGHEDGRGRHGSRDGGGPGSDGGGGAEGSGDHASDAPSGDAAEDAEARSEEDADGSDGEGEDDEADDDDSSEGDASTPWTSALIADDDDDDEAPIVAPRSDEPVDHGAGPWLPGPRPNGGDPNPQPMR